MKKIFKRKISLLPAQVEPDVVALINKIQQHLVSLEEKIDTLISWSQERSFGGKHFSKPLRSFSRSYGHGKGRQDNSSRERIFTQAICAECGKVCEVPFKPSGDRPVYCRDCFAKRKGGGSFRGKHDNSFGDENREFGQRKKPFFRRRKDRT